MKKLINHLTEKPDPEIQILRYKMTEYVRSRIIIMIHSGLHDHFSSINAAALLSFLKAAVQV